MGEGEGDLAADGAFSVSVSADEDESEGEDEGEETATIISCSRVLQLSVFHSAVAMTSYCLHISWV